MALIVQKFGGTSVANIERIKNAALKVKAERDLGHRVAVVVSAMSGVTNQLVDYCKQIDPLHDLAEYDAVVASGENVTCGLMAMALQSLGLKARSFQGWQAGIVTDAAHSKARILDIPPDRIAAEIVDETIPVFAGFQGATAEGRITTLGRGGSDTSAVALAAALKADRCDIYTDVDGVYTTDPRIVARARKLKMISYEEMLELAAQGAKVLQTRSVEMAMRHRVPVQVLSTFDEAAGSSLPGTMVVPEEQILEKEHVSGIAYTRDEAKVTLVRVADVPGVAARIFGPLAKANIAIDMIVQNVAEGGRTDLTFTVAKAELARAVEALNAAKSELGFEAIRHDDKVVKVSVVGLGVRSHTSVAQKMFQTLADRGINIQVISTSEIKISVLISDEYLELALRALHSVFGLDEH